MPDSEKPRPEGRGFRVVLLVIIAITVAEAPGFEPGIGGNPKPH